MLRNGALAVAAFALFAARPVLAHPGEEVASSETPAAKVAPSGGDEILPPPPTYKAGGVTVDEKLGAKVPVDEKFRTSDGKLVTLGDVLAGELPTILTFNYSDCPMLCSLQLNGMSTVMPKLAEPGPVPPGTPLPPGVSGDKAALRLGTQFRIVTIDLEPKEPLAKLEKMKRKYIERMPEQNRADARKGWTFLAAATPGDGASIRRVAEAVGFKYKYIPERAEWAHPAALIFLSTKGTVTRYIYGIQFDPSDMRESIFKAGVSESSSAVGFLNRCYHYDPGANSHARAGVIALRVAAAGCLILIVFAFGLARFLKKQRRPGDRS